MMDRQAADDFETSVRCFIENTVFSSLHDEQWRSIRDFLKSRKGEDCPTLAIAGPRPFLFPYNRHADALKKHLGEGNIAFLIDRYHYDDEYKNLCNAIAKPMIFLHDNELYEALKFVLNEVKVASGRRETKNIRRGVNDYVIEPYDHTKYVIFSNGCVSALDATLFLDKAGAYADRLDFLLEEASRVIEKGGLLHIGTPNLDTSYQQEKVYKIAKIINRELTNDVYIEDLRNPLAVEALRPREDEDPPKSSGTKEMAQELFDRVFFSCKRNAEPVFVKDEEEAGKLHERNSIEKKHITMQITPRGSVIIKSDVDDGAALEKALVREKYARLEHYSNMFEQKCAKPHFTSYLSLHLIDDCNPNDRMRFVKPVTAHYDKRTEWLSELASKRTGASKDIVLEAIRRDVQECNETLMGVTNFCIGPERLKVLLESHGFTDVCSKYDTKELYCSMTARKQ